MAENSTTPKPLHRWCRIGELCDALMDSPSILGPIAEVLAVHKPPCITTRVASFVHGGKRRYYVRHVDEALLELSRKGIEPQVLHEESVVVLAGRRYSYGNGGKGERNVQVS
jgi:hypothetical protein